MTQRKHGHHHSYHNDHHHHHEIQEVDVLCLIQCSSPFIQPDFLESGYKLLLQVIHVPIFPASSFLLAWFFILSNIYIQGIYENRLVTGSMIIIAVIPVFHDRHCCHLVLIVNIYKLNSYHGHHCCHNISLIRVTTRCSRRQDARSCAGKKWTVQGERAWCESMKRWLWLYCGHQVWL